MEMRQHRHGKGGPPKPADVYSNSGSSHYAIPRGGFFEYVSSPHYFGELVEWTGFFIATNCSLASLSFVVWAAANLVPRAIHTHAWYNERFAARVADEDSDGDGFDKSVNYELLGRKAIVPFIL